MSAKKCTAKSKRTGERCNANAVDGKEVCYHHGGKSTGHGTLKHGRYSKFLPSQLGEHYAAAISDPDLLSLKGEAELVQAFILDGVQAIDLNQCQAAWDTLEALAKMAYAADPGERGAIALEMANTIRDGVEPWKQIGRVLGYVDQKRTLADTESKRIKAQAETMTAQEAMALVAYMADAIRREFGDQPDRVARVTAELAVVVGGKADEPLNRAA